MYGATRDAGFGAEVKRRILLGTFVLSAGYYDAYYLKAQKVRTLIRRDFDAAFREVDVIVLARRRPTPAFRLGEKVDDPLAMYLSDVYTLPASLAGRAGDERARARRRKAGLPVGLQIIARPLDEATMLAVARGVRGGNSPRSACASPPLSAETAAGAWAAALRGVRERVLLPLLALRRARRTSGSRGASSEPGEEPRRAARARRGGARPRREGSSRWRATRRSGG